MKTTLKKILLGIALAITQVLSAQITSVSIVGPTGSSLTPSDTIFCGNSTITLTAQITGSATSPSYTWTVLSGPLGTTSLSGNSAVFTKNSGITTPTNGLISVRVIDGLDTVTSTVSVRAFPDYSLNAQSFCKNLGIQPLSGGTPAGGTYTSSISGAITTNGTNYFINPALAQNGIIPISYGFNGQSTQCLANSTATIHTAAQVTWTPALSELNFCKSAAPFTFTQGTPTGGLFIDTVGTNRVSSVGLVNPGAFNYGIHHIGYAKQDANGCWDTAWQQLNVLGSPIKYRVIAGNSPVWASGFINQDSVYALCSSNPTATFALNLLNGGNFTNYSINWGDGSGTSTGSLVQIPNTTIFQIPTSDRTHTYNQAGFFTVNLILTTNQGCTTALQIKILFSSTLPLGVDQRGNLSGCLENANDSLQLTVFKLNNWQSDPVGTKYTVTWSDDNIPRVYNYPLVLNGVSQYPNDLIYHPVGDSIEFVHTFKSTSCGTTPAFGNSNPNVFSVKIEKQDLCSATPTTFIISPIVINEYPNASVSAPQATCTNTSISINDNSTSGAHYVGVNQACNSTAFGVWKITPNSNFILQNGTTLGDRYALDPTTFNIEHFPVTPDFWTVGSTNLNLLFTKTGTYTIKRIVGRAGSTAACNIDSVEITICVDTIPIAEILVDSIPRFVCSTDNFGSRIKLDSINCSQSTNYGLALLPLNGNLIVRSFTPLPGTNKFEPDFSGLGGTFRLRYSASNGCGTSYSWDTVTVRAEPNFGFSTPSSSFCTTLPYVANFGSGIHEIIGNSAASVPNQPIYSITPSTGWTQTSISNGIPTISFTSYGTYTVQFTYTGLCGIDTAVQTIQITPLPISDFAGLLSQCGPLSNQLYSTSTAGFGKTIASYQWTVLPSQGATLSNPTDSSTSLNIVSPVLDSARYSVKLRIVDNLGCADSVVKMVTVYPNPSAVISGLPTSTCSPYTLNALSASSLSGYPSNKNQTLTYEWTIREGQSILATGTQASIQFTTTNLTNTTKTLWIRLKVTNISGCSDIDSVQLSIWPKPSAGIQKISNTCGPALVTGIDSSSAYSTTINTRQWSFSSGLLPQSSWTSLTGTTNVQLNVPAPTIDSQAYTLRLIITDARGCIDTAYRSFFVRAKPNALFGGIPPQVCAPYILNLTDSSTSNLSTLSNLTQNWKVFRNGVLLQSGAVIPTLTLTNTGSIDSTYSIRLWVQNDAGCIDSITKVVTVRPNALATIQLSGGTVQCAPFNFGSSTLSALVSAQNGASTWTVLSPNGSVLSGPNSGTWSYTITSANDSVRVRLIVSSALGCDDDTAFVWMKTVPNPIPVFGLNDTSFCSGQDLVVSNVGPIGHQYRWVLKDSITGSVLWSQAFSNVSNPSTGLNQALVNSSHTSSRIFVLKLIARAGGPGQCLDSISKRIRIWPSPEAVINSFNVGCAGDTIAISSNSIGTNLNTTWELYEITNGSRRIRSSWLSATTGSPSSIWVPSWSHPAVDSNYVLKLTTTNEFNCTDTAIVPFTVRAKPTVTFSPLAGGCGPWNTAISAQASGPTGRQFIYSWTATPSGTITPTNSQNVIISLPTPSSGSQLYTITVNASDQYGCSAIYTDTVRVWARPTASFGSITSVCDSTLLTPTDSSTSGLSATGLIHQWFLVRGNDTIATSQLANPQFLLRNRGVNDSLYSLFLIVSNGQNCPDTTFKTITVHPDAKVSLNTGTLTACTPFILNSSIAEPADYPGANGSYTWKILDGSGTVIKSGTGRSTLSDTMTTPSTTWTVRFIAQPLATGCKADSAEIQVSTVPNPVPAFTLSDTAFCNVNALAVTNIGPANHEYRWVLTNTATNTVVWTQPFSTTAQPGPGLINSLTNTSPTATVVYRLKLVARAGGSGQCADSTSKQITVLPTPDAVIAPISNICAGSALPLQSNSLGIGLNYQWTYYLGNSATGTPRTAWIDTVNVQSPTLNIPQWNHPAADSTYTIKLRITNEHNCVDSAVYTVTIYTRPTVTIVPVANDCGTLSLARTANIGGAPGRAYTYAWSVLSGGGSVTTASSINPVQNMPLAATDSLMHVIKLVITDQYGCSSEATDTTWTRARPEVDFNVGANYCDSSLAVIQNISNAKITADTNMTYSWTLLRGPWTSNFSGKHPSILLRNRGTQDSNYTLTLIVTNSKGCSDTLNKPITVHPDAKVSLTIGSNSACTPFVLDSNIIKAIHYPLANSGYTWQILDSNGIILKSGTGRNTLNDTITAPSTSWTVRFIAQPLATGCQNDTSEIQVSTVPNPVPAFTLNDASICLGSELSVSNIGPVGGIEYRWVLRDSASSTVLWNQNFSTTATPGVGLNNALVNTTAATRIFKLKLITRAGGVGGCLDSLERKIWLYPRPIAAFDSIASVCSDTALAVSDLSGLADQRQYKLYARVNNQWLERPNRISGATTPTPTLNFGSWIYGPSATDSVYTLKLTVISDSLCSDSTVQTFTIYARPAVAIDSLGPQCGPFGATLSAVTLAPAGRNLNYNWTLIPNTGIVSPSTATTPNLSLPTPSFGSETFKVILTVTDQFTCGTTDTTEVTVWARPTAQFSGPDSLCANGLFTPSNLSSSNSTDTTLGYTWNVFLNGQLWSSNVNGAVPSWSLPNSGTQDSLYAIELLVSNVFGCTDTVVDSVVVHPDARAELLTNNLINCAPFIIDSNRVSAQVHLNANSTYTWKTFDSAGQLRRIQTGPTGLNDTLFSANDSLKIRLTVQSRWGCQSDSAETWVYTLPNPDAAFAITPNDTVCHATQISASATNPSTGYSYTWWLRKPSSAAFIPLANGATLSFTLLTNSGIIDSTYELKLRAVNLGSGCADSTAQSIVVRPNPIPSIQTSVSCGLDTVQLNASAFAGAVNADNLVSTWTWTIQNQTISGQNINYFFGTAGLYPVRLQTSTLTGCDTAVWDTVTVYDYPVADFATTSSCGVDTVCIGVPFTVTSTSSTNSLSGVITSYSYDFNANGSIDYTSAIFNHTPTTPGALNLKLRIETEWGCRDSVVRQLWVNVPPTVSIEFGTDSICGPVVPTYTHSDSGLVDSSYFELYALSAGAKVIISSGQTAWTSLPTLLPNYRSDTIYYLAKSVFNCCGFATALDSIVVKTPPVANFALLPDSGCTPLNVLIQLDGLITGDADSAYISFGDGTFASYTPNRILQNGTYIYQWGQKNHTYSYSGFNDTTYFITLTVFNECGDSSLTKSVYLQPNTVQAFLQSNVTSGCAPLTVNFTNLSFNALNDNWCFNWNSAAQTCGGMSSTQSNPTWTFTQAGTYTVALFVDNGCGYDTAFTTITVFPAPVASASNNGPTCANDSIQFSGTAALSSGWVAGWRWEFGDGDTSALQNPIHVYDSSGTYTAKLIVTSSNGCQDSAFTTVTVLATPDVEFSALNACFNEQPIMFTNTSTAGSGSIVGTAWFFGDGNTSTAINPSHSYAAPGTYTVKLVHTTSTGCSDSATQIVLVYPTPSLSMQPVLIAGDSCSVPQTYQFNNSSTGTIGVFWDFNYVSNPGVDTSRLVSPSFTFTQAGIYTVALIGESAFGCTDTLLRQILVRDGVTAAIDVQPLSGCAPLEIRATNLSQFNSSLDTLIGLNWDFGDGTIVSDTAQNQFHTYGTAGTYLVTLTAFMASGCSDVVVSQPVTVHPTPQAGFRIDRVNLRTRQMVNLTVTSDPNTTYLWTFGDGATSTEFEPEHVYDPNRSGLDSLNVCLVATNSFGCKDSVCTSLWLWPAQLDVPNALAPDITYAGEDAVFLPKGHSLMEYELMIFDKWGNVVFVTTALDANGIPSEAWNGRLNNTGDPLPMGAYVWKIRAVFDDGTNWLTERSKIGKRDYGTVTLIR